MTMTHMAASVKPKGAAKRFIDFIDGSGGDGQDGRGVSQRRAERSGARGQTARR